MPQGKSTNSGTPVANDLRMPQSRRWVGHGINHWELPGGAEAHARIERWPRGS